MGSALRMVVPAFRGRLEALQHPLAAPLCGRCFKDLNRAPEALKPPRPPQKKKKKNESPYSLIGGGGSSSTTKLAKPSTPFGLSGL